MAYVRTQVQLRPDQHKMLKEQAFRRGISMSRIIREAIDGCSDRPARAEEGMDAALGIIGIVRDAQSDVAVRHDHYLYDEDVEDHRA